MHRRETGTGAVERVNNDEPTREMTLPDLDSIPRRGFLKVAVAPGGTTGPSARLENLPRRAGDGAAFPEAGDAEPAIELP